MSLEIPKQSTIAQVSSRHQRERKRGSGGGLGSGLGTTAAGAGAGAGGNNVRRESISELSASGNRGPLFKVQVPLGVSSPSSGFSSSGLPSPSPRSTGYFLLNSFILTLLSFRSYSSLPNKITGQYLFP